MIIYTIEKELLMKFKLTNYDPSNYKLLEAKLNELSKQGYNCKNVDMFTIFKHDNKRQYYKTDIFVPDKNKQASNREQRDKWLLEYVEHGYEFIGKSRKIFVFKAEDVYKRQMLFLIKNQSKKKVDFKYQKLLKLLIHYLPVIVLKRLNYLIKLVVVD